VDRLLRLAARVAAAAFLVPGLAAPGVAAAQAGAGPAGGGRPTGAGLLLNDPRAFQGYTLLAPLGSTKTYLIDMRGRVVRTWETNCAPASCAYLLENGHLLRPGTLGPEGLSFGPGPAAGGRVQEFTWDGELVWDYKLFNPKQMPTHDLTPLPNGNVLLIVWDKKSAREAVAAGRRPDTVGDYLLPDSLVEVRPTGKTTGKVVWEWHIWDHLVQDFDKSKANYGDVAAHPELIDVNFGTRGPAPAAKGKEPGKLRPPGFGGPPAFGRPRMGADWTHANSVAYNAALDQIVLSVHSFSEIWVLDHGTTTAEAAGHKGGRHGRGGDLLYRWGNPRAYRAGTAADQKLFGQHTAHWIPRGRPGEGHLLLFNNGMGRPGAYSSVEELVLPADAAGRYAAPKGAPYGPDAPVWAYTAPKKSDFFAMVISGAERLPNGNTLVCAGTSGTVFEVTPHKEVVWKYVYPARGLAGKGPGGPPPGLQLLPAFLRDRLGLSAGQKEELDKLQKDVDARLNRLLTEPQRKQLREFRGGFGAGGFGRFGFGPPPGISLFRVYRYGPDYPGLRGRELTPGGPLAGPSRTGPR
jgi:hypothetical protein